MVENWRYRRTRGFRISRVWWWKPWTTVRYYPHHDECEWIAWQKRSTGARRGLPAFERKDGFPQLVVEVLLARRTLVWLMYENQILQHFPLWTLTSVVRFVLALRCVVIISALSSSRTPRYLRRNLKRQTAFFRHTSFNIYLHINPGQHIAETQFSICTIKTTDLALFELTG